MQKEALFELIHLVIHEVSVSEVAPEDQPGLFEFQNPLDCRDVERVVLAEAQIQIFQMVMHPNEQAVISEVLGKAHFPKLGESVHEALEHVALEIVANAVHI